MNAGLILFEFKQVAYTPSAVSYPTQAAQTVAAGYSSSYVNAAQPVAQSLIKQEKKPSVAKYVVPTVSAAASATTAAFQTPSVHHTNYNTVFSSAQVQTSSPPVQTNATSKSSTVSLIQRILADC